MVLRDPFHLMLYFQSSLKENLLAFILELSNINLYGYSIFYLSICHLVETQISPTVWQL